MKIGILTHPLRTNCGGILQNYALQTVIRELGHDVETIDRHNDWTFSYRVFSWIIRIIRMYVLKQNINIDFYMVPTRKQFLRDYSVFFSFINEHIRLTPYIKCNKDLVKINDYQYDVVVVGSDQVWFRNYLPWTFLEFLDERIRRVSYAASFGKSKLDYTKQQLDCARKGLQSFYAVSVREDSGVIICKEHFDIDAVHVLDPTMLLSSDEYLKLCKDTAPVSNVPFLLSYILDSNKEKKQFVNKIAEEKGLKVVNFYDLDTVSVERWISLFRDSSYVVTDSFHGTVFSIIFNKQFVSITNTERGNARFDSLLKMFELNNHLADARVLNSFDFSESHNIDFSKVNRIREIEKIKSLEFLKRALS